jgi:hypothetical protein
LIFWLLRMCQSIDTDWIEIYRTETIQELIFGLLRICQSIDTDWIEIYSTETIQVLIIWLLHCAHVPIHRYGLVETFSTETIWILRMRKSIDME